MTDHAEALKRAADAYRRAQTEADKLMSEARQDLSNEIRAAYTDQVRIADILRHIGHVWSRTWTEKVAKGGEVDARASR